MTGAAGRGAFRSVKQADRILSLAAGVLPEHDGLAVARAAAEAGYTHFGVTVGETWSDADTRAVRALMRSHGLECLDAEVIWLGAGAEVTEQHQRIVAVAAELGAANVLVVSDEADTGRTAQALHRLCEVAAPAGLRVCLEFLRITAISRPSQALAAVRQAGHPAVGLLVDSLHLARSGEPAAVLEGHADLLPYLQLCDAPRDFRDDAAGLLEDALVRRSAPGEGELPLLDTLRLSPGVPLSLEVRSRAYRERYPDPAERAAAIRRQTLRFLEQLDG